MRRLVLLIVSLLAPCAGTAGDGTWTQFDAWKGGAQLVTNIERGRIVWGFGLGRDDGELWSRASALYTWQVGDDQAPWKLRAGPALKAEEIAWWQRDDHRWTRCLDAEGESCARLQAGMRLSADRWAEYGRWGTFVMADYTAIDDAALLVGGLTHMPSGLGGQLSVWHEAGGEVTPTLMASAPVTRRLRVRLGHKFVEDETFIGFSLSTY
ncbi:hypothetical protein [Paracoccus sp. (in: a-proteobacteria)]|uniref:hypothetical protein n=1 Tax=Paracoccus sp. TaxID=267 RepID=UPI0026E058EC|nr:hypothetical protein [Paracoccus sp. (in: a-proteobacteria)]MDO5369118.1 hypothetical protein [Paracoccus sp. (in: a-proteobacteria)]